MRIWTPCLVTVFASFLLLSGAAFAQEADCLEASALDQRSLTQLRADVEEACPCDSFDGGAGATRSHYEDCADDVLSAALSVGDVRSACRREAEAILGNATCGTNETTCGRIAPDADPVFSCRVTRETSCRGRPSGRRVLARRGPALGGGGGRRPIRSAPGAQTGGYAENACPEQTHCADVVEWTAGTCFDSREEGPYDPGVVTLTLTKPSAVDGTPRELETVVWYPAPAGSGERDAHGGISDAPLDLSDGRRPVVLFSHGSCGFPTQSIFLTAWLATHGYVVVSPPHPGNTVNEIATCGSNPDSAIERPEDMVFVLDEMLAADGDSSSPFFEALDADAVAMSGHSFGGFTTFATVARDPRIKVAMPFMAAVPPGARFDIPSLSIISDVDGTVNNARSVDAYQRSARPKWLVNILHAGHFAASGPCFSGPDCEVPEILSQAEANPKMKRWVLPFLKVFLEGDLGFAPFLAEDAGDGFAVEAE